MPATPYHHGDLPNALRGVAADLLGERGAAGFSMREVSRRAGVSHTAATHHFGDMAGLLTAVAVEAFQILATETGAAAAAQDDPVASLSAVGRAYVRVAVDHPGHCSVMFRKDLVDTDDEGYTRWALQAYTVLFDAVGRVLEATGSTTDQAIASSLCWAAVQGLVTLQDPMMAMAADHGGPSATIEDMAAAFTQLMVEGIANSSGPAPRP